MVTIFTYLKNPVSYLSDFLRPYSNESENKNKPASCIWSIFDRTNPSTEKIYTPYEIPDTQLLWAWGTRAWHIHGGPTPTSLQIFYIFSFWGHGGHVRLMKWKNNVFLSNLPISGSQKLLTFEYSVIKSWKNVRLKCINMSWRTLYIRVKLKSTVLLYCCHTM